jgi:hypothetical protein
MRQCKVFTENEELEMCLLYKEGKYTTEIAEAFQVRPKRILGILRRHEVPIRSASEAATKRGFPSDSESCG